MNFFFVENLQVLFFIMCDEIRIEFIYIFGEIVVFVTQKMECKLILHEKSLANAYDQIFNLFCTCKLTKCLPNVELQIYLMINKLFISFDSLIMLIIYTYSTWFFPLSLSTHFVQIFFKNKKPQHWWIYKTSKWMISHENNKNVKCWRSCELFFFLGRFLQWAQKTQHQTHLSSSLGAKNGFCAMFTHNANFWCCSWVHLTQKNWLVVGNKIKFYLRNFGL